MTVCIHRNPATECPQCWAIRATMIERQATRLARRRRADPTPCDICAKPRALCEAIAAKTPPEARHDYQPRRKQTS